MSLVNFMAPSTLIRETMSNAYAKWGLKSQPVQHHNKKQAEHNNPLSQRIFLLQNPFAFHPRENRNIPFSSWKANGVSGPVGGEGHREPEGQSACCLSDQGGVRWVCPNLTLTFWQADELLVLLLFLQPVVTVRDPVRREDANKILPLYSGEQSILQPGALPLVWQELFSVRMNKFRERLIQPVEEAKGSAHAGAVFRVTTPCPHRAALPSLCS